VCHEDEKAALGGLFSVSTWWIGTFTMAYLAVNNTNGSITLHDINNEYAKVGTIPGFYRGSNLMFNVDNSILAVATCGGIHLWNVQAVILEGAQEPMRILCSELDIRFVAFSFCGNRLAIQGCPFDSDICEQDFVSMLDFESEQQLWKHDYPYGNVSENPSGITLSPDGRVLLVQTSMIADNAGNNDDDDDRTVQSLHIMDAQNGLFGRTIGTGSCRGFALGPTGKEVAVVYIKDGNCYLGVWDLDNSYNEIWSISLTTDGNGVDGTQAVCFAGSVSKIIVGSGHGLVRLWDIERQTILWEHGEDEEYNSIYGVYYCPERNHVAVSYEEKDGIVVVDASSGVTVAEIDGPLRTKACFSKSGVIFL
jgi:WD40 repeat protein